MKVKIEFEVPDILLDRKGDLHCIDCPVRRNYDSACKVQLDKNFEPKEFEGFEKQRKECPLKKMKNYYE